MYANVYCLFFSCMSDNHQLSSFLSQEFESWFVTNFADALFRRSSAFEESDLRNVDSRSLDDLLYRIQEFATGRRNTLLSRQIDEQLMLLMQKYAAFACFLAFPLLLNSSWFGLTIFFPPFFFFIQICWESHFRATSYWTWWCGKACSTHLQSQNIPIKVYWFPMDGSIVSIRVLFLYVMSIHLFLFLSRFHVTLVVWFRMRIIICFLNWFIYILYFDMFALFGISLLLSLHRNLWKSDDEVLWLCGLKKIIFWNEFSTQDK